MKALRRIGNIGLWTGLWTGLIIVIYFAFRGLPPIPHPETGAVVPIDVGLDRNITYVTSAEGWAYEIASDISGVGISLWLLSLMVGWASPRKPKSN